jgi:hypothetical protein
VCYADLASAVRASVSSCADPCPTRHEGRGDGLATCLLLEYGVSTAAVALGWSQSVNSCWKSHALVGVALLADPADELRIQRSLADGGVDFELGRGSVLVHPLVCPGFGGDTRL